MPLAKASPTAGAPISVGEEMYSGLCGREGQRSHDKRRGHVVLMEGGARELGGGPDYCQAVPQTWGDDPGKAPLEGPSVLS